MEETLTQNDRLNILYHLFKQGENKGKTFNDFIEETFLQHEDMPGVFVYAGILQFDYRSIAAFELIEDVEQHFKDRFQGLDFAEIVDKYCTNPFLLSVNDYYFTDTIESRTKEILETVNPIKDISSLNEEEKEEYASELDAEFRYLAEEIIPSLTHEEKLTIDVDTIDYLFLTVQRMKELKDTFNKCYD